jgi:hypothetical protein
LPCYTPGGCPQRLRLAVRSSTPDGWVGTRGDVTIPRGWRTWMRPGIFIPP